MNSLTIFCPAGLGRMFRHFSACPVSFTPAAFMPVMSLHFSRNTHHLSITARAASRHGADTCPDAHRYTPRPTVHLCFTANNPRYMTNIQAFHLDTDFNDLSCHSKAKSHAYSCNVSEKKRFHTWMLECHTQVSHGLIWSHLTMTTERAVAS